MNHHYSDNYGYQRGGPGTPGANYSGGVGYADPTAMSRMNQPQDNYQMSHYPMMQQQPGAYGQASYMGPQGNQYNMGYCNYNMQGQASMMMGNRQGEMSRMGPRGNMMSNFYNTNQHSSAHMGAVSTQPSNYSHSHHHMAMMSSQKTSQPPMMTQSPGAAPMTSQTMHAAQAVQSTTSSGSHMAQQMPSHQSTGTYGTSNSPHMLPCSHHVPQHPMRHPTSQQNPQEVADNILQMASAYPSNQTVQVPLKSRPAPYHIPRSPHYGVQHSDLQHASPNSQQQQSPVSSQTSPSPSSSVKSPAPVLAPIPNPIPSPGISGIRSPCNLGMSPCSTQRSPSHLGSTYSGHSQSCPPSQCCGDTSPYHHGMSTLDTQHYSPCAMTPAHTYSSYNTSPASHRNTPLYSPSSDHSAMPALEQLCHPNFNETNSSGTCTNNSFISQQSNVGYHSLSSDNPLMSLQKLVMLPETQVVDPKSVVNDASLSYQDESPKNCDSPAERLAESLSHSVGFQGTSSSLNNTSGTTVSHPVNSNQEHARSDNNHSFTSSDSKSQEQPTPSDNILKKAIHSLYNSSQNNSQESMQLKEGNIPEDMSTMTSKKFNSSQNSISDSLDRPIQCGQNETLNNQEKCNATRHLPPRQESVSKTNVKTNGYRFSTTPVITVIAEESKKLRVEIVESSEQSLISPEKKNGKILDKIILIPCRSSGVLSEVPILTNGLNNTSCDKESDIDHDNAINIKLQNGLSLIKSKHSSAKRATHFSRLMPCSIAVGADERAACERFAYRSSRMLRTNPSTVNVRNRNNSTGNADSDESSENFTEGNYTSDNPQDGSKKRAKTTKKSDTKMPNLGTLSSTNNVNEGNSRSSELKTTGSNGVLSYHNNDGSDDDIYYEGVDSSDNFFHNFSSDESESKQTTPSKAGSDKADDDETINSLSLKAEQKEKSDAERKESNVLDLVEKVSKTEDSPPYKRLRRSSGHNVQVKLRSLSITSGSELSATPNLASENNEQSVTCKTKADLPLPDDPLKNVVVKTETLKSSQKSIVKYPVVLLDKSAIVSSSPVIKKEVSDVIDLTGDSCINTCEESVELPLFKQEDIKIEDVNQQNSNNKMSTVSKKKTKKKARIKKKDKVIAKVNRSDEVKDSFKSMKFSRTLDLMKSQRKRESFSSGPFIRVTGKPNDPPKKITVFCQPVPDAAILANTNNKQSKIKRTNLANSTPTVHMVTNLPTNKVTMVPYSRTISQNPWECAFCGHCSSYRFLGDLFGPYFLENELAQVDSIALEESKKNESSKDQKTEIILSGKKKKEILQSEKINCRRRKSSSVTRLSEQESEPPIEIWVHEACAMWSPGVHLIGSKMYGLDEAVKDATDAICSVCKSKGAMMGCLQKGCAMKYHFICAIDKDCFMDEESYSILCPKHKDKKTNPSNTSRS